MPQEHRPGAGDFTGQQKARAAREQVQAQKDRQAAVSMATAVEVEEAQNGLFDAQTGERIVEEGDDIAVAVEEPQAPRFFGRETEPTFTGKEPVEAQVAPKQEARRAHTRSTGIALNPIVTIRLDQDVENMTHGMVNGEPNNYNFKEGLAYRVPREVAEHLDARGLVRQWISA